MSDIQDVKKVVALSLALLGSAYECIRDRPGVTDKVCWGMREDVGYIEASVGYVHSKQ